MYGRFKKIILVMCFGMSLWGNEDSRIFEALEAIESGDNKAAFEIYENLYNDTKKSEYLKEMIKLSMHLRDEKKALKLAQDFEKIDKNDVDIKKFLAGIYAKNKDLPKATKKLQEVVKLQDTIENNSLLASLFLAQNDFKAALPYVERLFELEPNETNLAVLATTKMQTGEFPKKQITEFYEYEIPQVSATAFGLYAKDSNMLDALEELLLEYYEKKDSTINATNLAGIYLLQNQAQKAADLAKKHKLNDEITLTIYFGTKDYDNVIKVAQKLAESDKHYTGVVAIARFENAKSDDERRKIAPSVIDGLKIAVEHSPNEMMYNYLGYLMIDYDIDVKGGMEYVKLALAKEKDNEAYLDSLAWGFFKLGECVRAKEVMDKIPQNTSEEEIKKHREIIEKCVREKVK